MTDLSKGIIEINDFTFRPGTTIDEVKNFFGENIRVLELSTGTKIKFLKQVYLTENIYAYAFNFNKHGILTNFSLNPSIPSELDGKYVETSKYKVDISKKWLKSKIVEPSTSEGLESILYAYDWGYIRSATHSDPHYGLVGGEITIRYEE